MNLAFLIIVGVLGWIFMMENDQQHIMIVLPGSGQVGPFSVGVVILGAFLAGVLLCYLGGGLSRLLSRAKAKKPPSAGRGGGHSDGGHDGH
jgi:uncharacterized integral membrane protein|uniref:Lipopolysaccharide assembly protein A domain-containing protein n=1 Tax=Leptospirillum ferrodiazotrophum TaxID=412449 RepID=C6HXL3_9BACT|nr:MAG: hypothetical protein UBAL3_92050211 [Leptospirillum ferrodiazotrophum]